MDSDFLFIHYGYDKDLTPSLSVHKTDAEAFEHITPRGQTLTLTFAPDTRFCRGWHDLATGHSYPCPDNAQLPAQFDTCRHCQNKTGFNPAFYNASSVSPQQEARNATPHFLYLAHFAPGVVKVGISWAERDLRRLLDQGARSCLIIKTYPTANIARQYEAKVSKLPGIAETLQVKAKHKLLNQPYDADAAAAELREERERLISELAITPDNNEPVYLDSYYLGDAALKNPIILDGTKISGHCVGMVGCLLVTEQDGQQFGLSLSNFTGYRARIDSREEVMQVAPRQASLF